MENTEKVQDYNGGEIRRTLEGYFIFIKGGAHSGPYVSISAARGAVGAAVDSDAGSGADKEATNDAVALGEKGKKVVKG